MPVRSVRYSTPPACTSVGCLQDPPYLTYLTPYSVDLTGSRDPLDLTDLTGETHDS